MNKVKNILSGQFFSTKICIHDTGEIIVDHKIVPISDVVENIEISKICSWNIQELFTYTKKKKISNILNYIKNSDVSVMCIQEAFELKTIYALIENREIRKKYPYFLTGCMKSKFYFGENSGLFVLSKRPIHFVDFLRFPFSSGFDSFANKGVLYFRTGGINFSNSHLQSNASKIARKQLLFIKANSPFKNYILVGDLNLENVASILDVGVNNTSITHNSNKIIDYIFPINYKMKLDVKVDRINLNETSDHYPLIALIVESD